MKLFRYLTTTVSGCVVLFSLVAVGCQHEVKPDNTELKTTIRRVMEGAWNDGDLAMLDELYDPGFVRHRPPFDDYTGLDAHKKRIEMIRAAYPDHRIIIHDILVDGDAVAMRYTWTGTNSGEGLSLSPTGKRVSVDGCDVYRLVNGKIVEEWVNEGYLNLYQQLGYEITPPKSE